MCSKINYWKVARDAYVMEYFKTAPKKDRRCYEDNEYDIRIRN